jgi:autotransporter-associated beta strand protein
LTNTRIALAGTTNLTTDLDFGGTFDINGLTVNSGAGAFIVNSVVNPTILRIGGNGVAVNANNAFTVNAPVLLGAAQTWTNAGTGIFTVGTGGLNLGGFNLTVAGAGATRFTGPVSGGGTVTNNATPALLVSGPVDLSGATTLAGTGTTNVTGVISGGSGLTKTGTGVVTLGGANTYTGTTTISQGVLAVNRATAGATALGNGGTITLGGGTLSFRATATPVGLTAASFTQDVISSAGDIGTVNPFGTTAGIDANPGALGWVLFENRVDFLTAFFPTYPTNSPTGLPSSRVINSAANAATSYQLQPYQGAAAGQISNNALFLSNDAGQTNTGTITLTTGGSFQTISLLATSGSASSTFTATLKFSSGADTVVTGLVSPDWFNGTPFAISNLGRMEREDGFPDAGAITNPRLYPIDIHLSAADQARTLTSIQIDRSNATGGRLNIFGLSGAAVGGPTSYANNVIVTANSTIEMLNTGTMGLGSLTIGGNTLTTAAFGTTTLTFNGTTLGGNPTFNVAAGQTLTPGAIDFGAANRTFTKSGGGTIVLGAAGTNFGAINRLTVTAGTANVTNGTALGGTPDLTVTGGTANLGPYTALNSHTISGGTANLPNVTAIPVVTKSGGTTNYGAAVTVPTYTQTGGTTNFNAGATVTTAVLNNGTMNVNGASNFASFAGNGNATLNVSGANVLTYGSGNQSNTFTGFVNGTGTLVKTGTGTQTFTSGGSANSGGMTIAGGQVTATRPGALGTGAVTINDGATLAIGGLPGSTINGFNLNGTGWTLNGGPAVANDVLTLTTNANNQTRSAWFNTQQPTNQNFTAVFDYTRGAGSGNPADGWTFTLQNQAATALGTGGGGLGYGGITPSASLQVNIYNPNGRGIAVRTNGAVAGGGNYTAVAPVDIFNGTVRFTVNYTAGTNALNIVLTQGANTFTLPTQTVNLASVLGANTWVGFTGATGGENATQTISNFSFNLTGAVNPPISTYANAVNVAAGASATVTPIIAPNVGSFTMGALTIGSAGTGGTLNVQAGTGSTADAPYTLTYGATTLNGTSTLNVLNNGTGAGTVVLGAVGGSGDLVKNGPGVLVLAAASGNTYAGTTSVNAGNLRVTGTVGTGGGVEVNAGGTLSGTGTISRSVTVKTGGIVQGGLGVTVGQTLTTGDLTFAGGTLRTLVSNAGITGTTNVDTTTAGASRVAAAVFGYVPGTDINVFLVSDTGANALVSDGTVTYTRRLATYTSLANLTEGAYPRGQVGNPFIVTGQPFDSGAWTINVASGNVDIVFTPVPEPATVFGIAAAAVGLAGAVRRVRRNKAAV